MAAIRCTQFAKLLRKLVSIKNVELLGRRTYLSAQYACDHVWQKRFEEPVIKKINMGLYYAELNQKFQTSKRISSIDIDLFAHKITDVEQLDELEDLLRKFRRTPDAVHMSPSTPHAVIKSFFQFGQYEMLLKILNDRHNYGIFPDHYCYSFMLDELLKIKNNRDATKIATLMMLQEDFSHPISKHLALYSCLSYVRDPQPGIWSPDPPPPPPKETDDIIVIRTSYLKPDYFDDHFDIKEPNKLIGKTLAMLGSEFDNEIGRTCKIIGNAMYEKWEKLRDCIVDYVQKHQSDVVYKESIGIVSEILTKLPDEESENIKATIAELKPLVEQMATKTIDRDIQTDVEKLILKAVTEQESSDIEQQIKLSSEWSSYRTQLVEDQIQEYVRKMRIKKVEEMKDELKKKEQLLFFFENYETNMMKVDQFEKVVAEVAEKNKLKKIEVEYIPPEVDKPHIPVLKK